MKLSRYEQEKVVNYQDEVSKTYSLPKSYVSYRKPRKLSMEQREQAKERKKKVNTKK